MHKSMKKNMFCSCRLQPIGKRVRTVKTHRSVQAERATRLGQTRAPDTVSAGRRRRRSRHGRRSKARTTLPNSQTHPKAKPFKRQASKKKKNSTKKDTIRDRDGGGRSRGSRSGGRRRRGGRGSRWRRDGGHGASTNEIPNTNGGGNDEIREPPADRPFSPLPLSLG